MHLRGADTYPFNRSGLDMTKTPDMIYDLTYTPCRLKMAQGQNQIGPLHWRACMIVTRIVRVLIFKPPFLGASYLSSYFFFSGFSWRKVPARPDETDRPLWAC